MRQLTIAENEANQRFDKYLKKRFPNATGGFLYKMLRKKNILLNGKKADGSEHLTIGDEVKVFFSEETFYKLSSDKSSKDELKLRPFSESGMRVLYENENILAVNKPAGMLSQKASLSDYSANEWIVSYLFETGALDANTYETFHPSVSNRLDRNTSGILLAGKTLKGLQFLADALKKRTLTKEYLCLVKGRISKEMMLRAYLKKDVSSNTVTVIDRKEEGASQIVTKLIPVNYYENDVTLLRIDLITGKTHQIRAQLAKENHPIIGDPKYGDGSLNQSFLKNCGVSRQLLHAAFVTFPDGTQVEAPLPDDFKRAISYCKK